MSKLKVVTVLGTRPEIIRLAECIKKCDLFFDHVLVHTGQNYDYTLNEIFFEDLDLRKPDHFLNVAGNHLGETIGNVIAKSYEILTLEKPDALLVLGDTNSVLCTIAAKRLKIPIFHMEAGNRCFDQNVPEEINRKISDHISDINLTYTEHSRRYLLSEGFRKDHVFVTGSPLREVLNKYQDKIKGSDVNNITFHPLISNIPPLGFFDYVKLQQNAFIVLSDSGTISEESAMMGFPAVSIRTSTERPEAIDAGTIVLGGITEEQILNSIEISSKLAVSDVANLPVEYNVPNTSERVVKVIQSYTSIVDRVIWNK